MYPTENTQSSARKKYRMDDKIRSETKIKEKNMKIIEKIEILKEEINKIFHKNESDYIVRIKTLNSLKRDILAEKEN